VDFLWNDTLENTSLSVSVDPGFGSSGQSEFSQKLSNQNRAISARFPPSCWGKITMAPLIWVFFYEKSIISKGYFGIN
jgi:hypothetical protein